MGSISHTVLSEIKNPCFLLQEERLQTNLDTIRHVRDTAGVEMLIALKGFAMAGAFPAIAQVANGACASSLNEALHAAPHFGHNIHAYAPVYLEREFDDIARLCSHITFNSLNQLEHFRSRANNCSIGLRVNPEYSDVATALYNPCAAGSRLGIRREILANNLPPDVKGLHIHNLCESTAEATAATIDTVEKLYGGLLDRVHWLNLGGGHLMTRNGYHTDTLIDALHGVHQRHPHLQIILEPGAAFVWDAGVLVSHVMDIVEQCGIRTAILDVSFACHMPDCLEMPYTPGVEGARIRQPGEEEGWRLGGCSCLAGDVAGDYLFERAPCIGDTVVFRDMMHYTMVKTTLFNGIQHPDICIYNQTEDTLRTLRTFSYKDYRERL